MFRSDDDQHPDIRIAHVNDLSGDFGVSRDHTDLLATRGTRHSMVFQGNLDVDLYATTWPLVNVRDSLWRAQVDF